MGTRKQFPSPSRTPPRNYADFSLDEMLADLSLPSPDLEIDPGSPEYGKHIGPSLGTLFFIHFSRLINFIPIAAENEQQQSIDNDNNNGDDYEAMDIDGEQKEFTSVGRRDSGLDELDSGVGLEESAAENGPSLNDNDRHVLQYLGRGNRENG
jgi:hypothetical protein